jgi:hypothetical protein
VLCAGTEVKPFAGIADTLTVMAPRPSTAAKAIVAIFKLGIAFLFLSSSTCRPPDSFRTAHVGTLKQLFSDCLALWHHCDIALRMP